MAARPGQTQDVSWRKDAVYQIALLVAMIVDLIHKGKRGPDIIDVLIRALQAVRDNTLGGIVLKNKTVSDLQGVLSLLVSQTGMPEHLKKYLAQRGVRYLGEIYLLVWDRRGAKVMEVREEVFSFLRGILDLPEAINVETQWRPPYWDDPSFLAALSLPISRLYALDTQGDPNSWRTKMKIEARVKDPENLDFYITTMFRYEHAQGSHYAGQGLARDREWGVGQMRDLQACILKNSGLWAAALIPPNWEIPSEFPEEWTRELEVIEREKELARERARLQAAERRDRVVQQFQPSVEVPLPEPLQQGDFLSRMLTDRDYLKVLFQSVDQLEDSPRVAKCLEKREIKFIGEILLFSDAQMLKWQNFGPKSLEELKGTIFIRLGTLHDTIPAPQLEVLRRALELRREGGGIDEILTTVREQFQL